MASAASSTFFADELEAVEMAQAALEREQSRRANTGQQGNNDSEATTAGPVATASLLQSIPPSQRLPMLQRQMSDLELASTYAAYLRQYHPDDVHGHGRGDVGIERLTAEVRSVAALSQILYRHSPQDPPRRSKRTRHDPTHLPPYARILMEGYRPFHARVRAKLLLEFRRCLRNGAGGSRTYPSPSACRSLRDALEQSAAPEWEGGGVVTELTTVVALLVRLQLYHDALVAHLNGVDDGDYGNINHGDYDAGEHNGGTCIIDSRRGTRLDVVDELIRPLVMRVQFHFVDESGSGGSIRMTSSNLAELPRWLFRYVQNAITGAEEGENATAGVDDDDGCGILGVLLDGLLPVIQSEAEQYRMSFQQKQELHGTDDSDMTSATDANNRADTFLRHHPFTSPSSPGAMASYLLSVVSTLVADVLQRRDYVRSLSSRTPVEAGAKALMDGIEQCLRFDVFAQDLLSEESDQNAGTIDFHRKGITLKLLLKNPPLLDLWIDIEQRRGVDSLRVAPVLVTRGGTIAPLSPLAEQYASLITSILAKSCALTSSIGTKRKFVAGTAVPLTTYAMDCIHEAATSFRDSMLHAAGRRSAEMDVEALLLNLQDWLDLICGIDMATFALESSPSKSNTIVPTVPVTTFKSDNDRGRTPMPMTPFTPANQQALGAQTPATHGTANSTLATPGGQDQDLLRLSQSMQKLRNAIVEEYSSTLVETVLMERSGLASYFMTAPNRLMGDAVGDVILSSTAGDIPVTSKELEQPLGVLLSILDKLCMVHSSSSDRTGSTNYSHPTQQLALIDNAAIAIMTNVGSRIEEKFEELIIDPSGSIPEIQRSGALQLLSDVQLMHAMFDSVNDVMNNATDENFTHITAQPDGIFGRLVVLARLMCADDKQIQSLRDVMFGLAADAMPHLTPGMNYIPSQPFEDDGTLHETARSMLESKGFGAIELEDAISILNRRKVKSTNAAAALGRL